MSFRCQQCKKSSEPGAPMTKVVVETRVARYPDDRTGIETVREIAVCPPCALETKPSETIAAWMAFKTTKQLEVAAVEVAA